MRQQKTVVARPESTAKSNVSLIGDRHSLATDTQNCGQGIVQVASGSLSARYGPDVFGLDNAFMGDTNRPN
jgi:hypothetical protein